MVRTTITAEKSARMSTSFTVLAVQTIEDVTAYTSTA
jgi:hypothetical protein